MGVASLILLAVAALAATPVGAWMVLTETGKLVLWGHTMIGDMTNPADVQYLQVTANATIGRRFTSGEGYVTMQGAAIISGNLIAGGAVTTNNQLISGGSLIGLGGLSTPGPISATSATASQSITASTSVTSSGSLQVGGSLTATSWLSAQSGASAGSLSSVGNVNADGWFRCGQLTGSDASVAGNLVVSGNGTITGNVWASSLTASGNVDGTTMNLSQNLTTNSLSVAQDFNVTGTLRATSITASNVVSASSTATIRNQVSGSSWSATGTLTAQTGTFSGALTAKSLLTKSIVPSLSSTAPLFFGSAVIVWRQGSQLNDPCTSSLNGTLAVNYTSNTPVYCNGVAWSPVPYPPQCASSQFVNKINGQFVCSSYASSTPFAGSAILSPAQQVQLNMWTGMLNTTWALCYRKSRDQGTFNGMLFFFNQCRGLGPIMVVISRAGSPNTIFGGYTNNPGLSSYLGTTLTQRAQTFLYTFNTPQPKRFPIVENQFGWFHNANPQMCFGSMSNSPTNCDLTVDPASVSTPIFPTYHAWDGFTQSSGYNPACLEFVGNSLCSNSIGVGELEGWYPLLQ